MGKREEKMRKNMEETFNFEGYKFEDLEELPPLRDASIHMYNTDDNQIFTYKMIGGSKWIKQDGIKLISLQKYFKLIEDSESESESESENESDEEIPSVQTPSKPVKKLPSKPMLLNCEGISQNVKMRIGFETNFKLPFNELLRVVNGSYTPKNEITYYYHPESKKVYGYSEVYMKETWVNAEREIGEKVFSDFSYLDIKWEDDTIFKIIPDNECIKMHAESSQDNTKCAGMVHEGGIYYVTNLRPNQTVCIYCKNNCIRLFPGETWCDSKSAVTVDCACGDCNCEW